MQKDFDNGSYSIPHSHFSYYQTAGITPVINTFQEDNCKHSLNRFSIYPPGQARFISGN